MELAQLAKDIQLLSEKTEVAKTLAAEAAGEGEEGMLAVAHVINNRSVKQGKSPLQIITKKNQFYGTTAKNRDALYKSVQPVADKIVELMYQKKLGKDITGGAEYFRQPKEPIYKWHGQETTRIGNHIFHKERVK